MIKLRGTKDIIAKLKREWSKFEKKGLKVYQIALTSTQIDQYCKEILLFNKQATYQQLRKIKPLYFRGIAITELK